MREGSPIKQPGRQNLMRRQLICTTTLLQLMRFATVGGMATGIQYLTLYELHIALGIDGQVATTAGFIISAIFNFTANYHFTFRSHSPIFGTLVRFAVSAG